MKSFVSLLVLCALAAVIGPDTCARSGPIADGGAGAADPAGGPKYVRMAIIKGKRTRIPGPPLRRSKAK